MQWNYIQKNQKNSKNNAIKDIIKVIKFLQNRETLLEETTRNISGQKGGYLNFLRLLMSVGFLLVKSILTLLIKSVLVPFGLTAVALATDAAIQKRFFGSKMTALIISNKEIEDIMKIDKSLEELGLLIKGVSETKKQEGRFFRKLLGT